MIKLSAGVNIRLALKSDVDQLIELENRCFTTERFNKNQFKYIVEKANGFVYVYEEKKIIGSVILLKRKSSKKLRIYSIAVDPDYQGLGIASKLLRQAEEVAVDCKMKMLTLEVKTTNQSAIKLYQKWGFKTIAVKDNYYSDGNSALIMQKEI